jgi:succinyl-CoA synthetase beta subunit
MNIHEFQTKEILSRYGIPVPDYAVASTLEEVNSALDILGLQEAVVKIQVHAGGRGKAGGVKLAKSRAEILKQAQSLLGMKLVNQQTGSEGVVAERILISPLVKYKKEFYVGAVIDRQRAQGVLILSPEGGVEIEEVAKTHPEKVLTVPLTLEGKLRGYQHVQIAKFMGWKGRTAEQGKLLLNHLGKAFVETDASLLEINPLVETPEGDLVALDAKLSVDENALFRQPILRAFYDPAQIPTQEAQAKKFDLAYVALDGEIGCMVNGAGLAMATMDIIHHFGGKPANFLDVGGGATQERVAEGFKIILGDPKVKAIFVNIFGGIMNCLTLAAGIVAAASELQVKVPLIVRMEGTNVEQGKKLLADSGLNIQIANSLNDGAQKVVAAAKGEK